jgi:hypothetical protein
MNLTNEEAKKKWCPFVRLPHNRSMVNSQDYKIGDPVLGSHCIGSKCAVWQWDYKEVGEVGYCGMAASRSTKPGPKEK